MPQDTDIPLLDHELAEDELAWIKAIYENCGKIKASLAGQKNEFNPKEALREVLGREEFKLTPRVDLSGAGPWRLGQNHHGRGLAVVFLSKVELHRHPRSRTDQFPMYVVGEADAFSLDENGQPGLTPVTGGDQFHNSPDAPHAFLPRVGKPVPANWEIAFIAITPRDLREDTLAVSDEIKAAYKRLAGAEAPVGA